jgi:hypothetical protein
MCPQALVEIFAAPLFSITSIESNSEDFFLVGKNEKRISDWSIPESAQSYGGVNFHSKSSSPDQKAACFH